MTSLWLSPDRAKSVNQSWRLFSFIDLACADYRCFKAVYSAMGANKPYNLADLGQLPMVNDV